MVHNHRGLRRREEIGHTPQEPPRFLRRVWNRESHPSIVLNAIGNTDVPQVIETGHTDHAIDSPVNRHTASEIRLGVQLGWDRIRKIHNL